MHLNSIEKLINRRMPIITALMLALIVLTGACNKGSSGGNAAGGNAAGGGGGGAAIALTPIETVKAYYEANNKKDVAGIKKYLSKASLDLMERGAKTMNKSVDDAIRDSLANSPQANITPQYGNQKINGDSATVEVNAQGQTVSMPLVKEAGEWKLAIDKLIQSMGGQMGGGTVPGGESNQEDEHDGH